MALIIAIIVMAYVPNNEDVLKTLSLFATILSVTVLVATMPKRVKF